MIIHKLELVSNRNTYELSSYIKAIHVGHQNGIPKIWVLLGNQEISSNPITFDVVLTGEIYNLTTTSIYIGTIQLPDGIVLHVFQK